MTAVPLKRQQRYAVEVKERLLQKILRGEIPPGRRIIELQVADEMNVSQMSVREALNELERSGLIETEYYRGSRVRLISPPEVVDLCLLKGTLECLAAKLAVEHFTEEREELLSVMEKAIAAVRKNDRHEFAIHERQFCQTIVAASKCRPLVFHWRSITMQLELAEHQHKRKVRLLRSLDILSRVIEAFESRDGDRAGRLLAKNTRGIVSARNTLVLKLNS